ncbi:MAG: hypothetical protein LBL04_01390, partial [Bacteroidales bacterium]|nr:hypothetical protein [Bacteroidales bacterium]
MNKFIKWSFLAALSLFAGACKGTPAGEPSRLEVSAEELLFWPQASSKTVQVSGHPEFTATLADFLDRSWCGLEIVAGKTGNLVVSVTDNP